MSAPTVSTASSQTLSPPPSPAAVGKQLQLDVLPPIYVSLTHFPKEDADAFEEQLLTYGAQVTYDVNEARIVLTKVERKRRAQFDLRGLGLWTEDVAAASAAGEQSQDRTPKRRRIDSDANGFDVERSTDGKASLIRRLGTPTIKMVKVAWMEGCIAAGQLVPFDEYLVYEGRPATSPKASPEPPSTPAAAAPHSDTALSARHLSPESILARARADAQETSPRTNRDFGIRKFGDKNRSTFTAPYAAGASSSQKPPHLLLETTSEHESDLAETELPPAPEWVTKRIQYSCQRRTPSNSPNEAFISLLKDIRTARLLTGDEIGVRAYSSSIAAIASYPYPLRNPREVLRLPGCDVKIANLFVEFSNTGIVKAAEAAKSDPDLTVLRKFYDIWGVGATTAREFFYTRGWRDLDDVVEFGWSGLSRVQQIGVKYFEELNEPMSREEVEGIARTIHAHAVKVRDERVTSLLVGGYRRGAKTCGDVDLLVSHPDVQATKDLVTDIVASLEEEGCITHTLLLALTSTHRDQQTLPFRAAGSAAQGSGFDTLDKALVVWQDPAWPGRAADLAKDEKAKNPAPHRRVDIIVSPWRTVGCGVAGWSGGTTFQRDLRRYAKNVLGWKFDSSGIRDKGSGRVVDVEGYYAGGGGETADEGRGVIGLGKWTGRAEAMEEAERRVFEGMGLQWIDPRDRCTG